MKAYPPTSLFLLLSVFATPQHVSASIQESFATDPFQRGWSHFGDSALFVWDPLSRELHATWDSSRPNSYCEWPLGTELSRWDDFRVRVDFALTDLEPGVDPEKPGTFQFAFGFQRRRDAHLPTFVRGTGQNSPNLAEFNFFPDAGFGPTVWPALFSAESQMNYSSSNDFSLFQLPIGVRMQVEFRYSNTTQSASVSIRTNGVLVGPITTAKLMAQFTDFRLDTFAFASYSDAGQSPFMPGSIRAHAVVHSVEIEVPSSPISEFQGHNTDSGWSGSFRGRSHWMYQLQASENLESWIDIGALYPGRDGLIEIQDTTQPRPDWAQRFYRVTGQSER